MDLKKILLTAICFSCISISAHAAGEIPTGIMDAAGSAGNLHVHDMDRIKELDRLKEQEQDWKDLKKRQKEELKNKQESEKIEKKTKKKSHKGESRGIRNQRGLR